MGGVSLQIDQQGVADMNAAINRLASRVSNMTPAFKAIGQHLLRTIDQRFDAEVSPAGDKWADISEYTKRKKLGTFGQDKILTETGRLRRSITYLADRERLQVGTNVSYGKKHQLGAWGGSINRISSLPARPFLGLSAQEEQDITRITLDWMARSITRGSGSAS